jgi:hypothetical protein
MSVIDSVIVAVEITLALAVVLPLVQTAAWVICGDRPAVPELGPEPEPEELVASLDRAVNRPVPAMAASIATPATVLTIPVESRPALSELTAVQLRRRCAEQGIRWRNAHGRHHHLSKAEMVAALG